MNNKEEFQKWWEQQYETSPHDGWEKLYSYNYDYYLDEEIDGQYDAWKAGRRQLAEEITQAMKDAGITLA